MYTYTKFFYSDFIYRTVLSVNDELITFLQEIAEIIDPLINVYCILQALIILKTFLNL